MTHGPVVIRRRLGAVLKQLRGQRRLHLDGVARQLEVSPSKLSRLETGQVEPKIRDVRDLLDIYEATPEVREQVMQWVLDAKTPGWWQPFSPQVTRADLDLYISLEAEARSVQIYSTPISGLLQTEAYARSILSAALSDATQDEIDRLVSIRTGRQEVISSARMNIAPLELHAVIDEAALHRRATDVVAMTGQLQHLLDRSHEPHITLQVLPFSAGFTRAVSTFAIFEPRLPTDWAVVNVESTGIDSYFDTPTELSWFRTIWRDVLIAALDPESSRGLILDVLKASTDGGTS